MRIELAVSDNQGVDAKCALCGQWFPVGNVIGKVVLDEGGSTARDVEAVQRIADRAPWHPWGVCAHCLVGGQEMIRQGAAARALDLAERTHDQVQLIEAIRSIVLDLPSLTMEQYIDMAFPMAYPAELRDDDEDPTAASRLPVSGGW